MGNVNTLKTVIIPDAEELTRRLIGIDNEPHMIEHFYPKLMSLAGTERAGGGIVTGLVLAVNDYTEGMPPFMAQVMFMKVHQFLGAFTDNPEVLKEARNHLAAAGLPTG
jgi:hypothetical protein